MQMVVYRQHTAVAEDTAGIEPAGRAEIATAAKPEAGHVAKRPLREDE